MPRATCHFRALTLAMVGAAIAALAVMTACDVTPTVPAGSPSFTPATSPISVPSTAVPSEVKADGTHGFLTLEPSALRAEASSVSLATMPVAHSSSAAPDGRRVAIIERTRQGGRLVTFSTSRAAQPTFAVEFSGSVIDNRATGEFPSAVVWAGDGSDSLLVTVDVAGPPTAYTSERVIDLQTQQVRELARVGFVPLAWHPSSGTAVGWAFRGDGGFADSYVVLQGDRVTRSPFPFGHVIGTTLRASPDGLRVLAMFGGGSAGSGGVVRWWPFDRFDQQTELPSLPGDTIVNALWRPGMDEIVVSVVTATSTPSAPRLEVWPLRGAPRVLRANGGLLIVRSDGTAALGVDYVLVDLATGATSTVPRLSPLEVPYLAVRL